MTFDLFLALVVFAAISAFTPGPNNTLALASGMNFGFRRTLPQIAGVGIGFPLMIAAVGLGLGQVFKAFPLAYQVLKYLGAAYMLWLAWKIATARLSSEEEAAAGKPLTFLQSALFQWVNPKGWIMAVTALSAYTVPASYQLGVAVVVGTFVFMGFTSSITWVLFGAALRHLMNDPRYFRPINLALAALLVLSLVPLLWH
jgi:threonine/homoserine/homoserine lactone efflux protein